MHFKWFLFALFFLKPLFIKSHVQNQFVTLILCNKCLWRTDRHTLPPNDSTLRKNTPTSYFHYIRDVGNISKWKRMIKTSPKKSSKKFHQIWRPNICNLLCRLLSLAPSPWKVSLCSSYLPGIPNLSTSASGVSELQEYSTTHSLLS